MSRLEGSAGENMPLTLNPREDRALNEAIYRRNFAHRDYFNGKRNYFEDHEQSDAFPVIHQTHISHAFLSHALSRESMGTETSADYCWKLSVATPIWADVPIIQNGLIETVGKAIGLLMCGIFVKEDLEDAFGLSQDHESGASEFVLLNSRGAWVLHHGDYRERLLENIDGRSIQRRDPQCYHDLRKDYLERCSSRASESYHELMARHATPSDGRTRAQPVSSLNYVDLLKGDQNWPAEIASLNRFNPYRNSYYSTLRDSAAAWTFIAQLDRARTLGEVDRIQKEFLVTAIFIVAGLLIVVVILWVWLIRLVHRGEFAANG
jgi:hypothetical protein